MVPWSPHRIERIGPSYPNRHARRLDVDRIDRPPRFNIFGSAQKSPDRFRLNGFRIICADDRSFCSIASSSWLVDRIMRVLRRMAIENVSTYITFAESEMELNSVLWLSDECLLFLFVELALNHVRLVILEPFRRDAQVYA